MISTLYLHEHDILDSFLEETHHIMNDVYDARNRLIAAENYIDEQVFMGESANDYQVMLEETKKNVFAKIGDKVKEWVKRFCDMLTKFGKDIKGYLTGIKKHKSDEALKEQMRNDPELAEKFINAVMSGNIKIHDVKDMDDLLKTAQELTKELASGKINEEQYMDKVDKKLEKYAGRAKAITAILGVVIGTTGILAAIDKLGIGGADAALKTAKAKDEMNEMRELAMREANSEAGGNSNRISVWLRGQQKFAAALGNDCSGWRSTLAKAEGWLGNRISGINTGYSRQDNNGAIERNRRRRETELRNAEDLAAAQQRGRLQGEDEFNRDHPADYSDDQYKGYYQQWGRNQADKDWKDQNPTDYTDDENKAYHQQWGRKNADNDWRATHPAPSPGNNNGGGNRNNNNRGGNGGGNRNNNNRGGKRRGRNNRP